MSEVRSSRSESAVADLHRRAGQGIRLLVGRQAVLQLLAITGGILIARWLGPTPIGLFGIALFAVNVLGLLADFGLRTALIQQAAPPSEQELRTCLTVQLVFATLLVAGMFRAAPVLAGFYPDSPPELTTLLRLLALDLYLRAWRSLSEVRLERELHYRELAIADLAASAAYHAVALGLVLGGHGAISLVWATLAGGLLRAALLQRAARWAIRLHLSGTIAWRLLRAGLPLQVNEAVGRAPGWVTPTLVGALMGPEAVGLLTWAASVGRKPLEVLQNVARVSLSHFARLQDDVLEIERVLSRYVIASLLVCGLWLAVLGVAGRDLVSLVYTDDWLPALPALLVFAASAMFASVRWLAAAALVAIGRARLTARVSTVAAAVSIVASALLVLRIGLPGVPLGQLAGIVLAVPWLLRGLRSTAPARVLRDSLAVVAPMVATTAVGALTLTLPVPAAARAVVTAAAMAVSFMAATWWFGPAWLRSLVREELMRLVVRSGAPRGVVSSP